MAGSRGSVARVDGMQGRLVRTDSLGTALLSETLYDGDELLAPHRHGRGYVSVLADGAYTEVCDSETQMYRGATMIYYPTGELHADHFHRAGRCVNVELSEAELHRLAAGGFPAERRTVVDTSAAVTFLAGWDGTAHGAERALNMLLDTLAAHARTMRSVLPRPPWFEAALAVLDSETGKCLAIGDLAARVGVHPTHLAREFRRRVRCTPSEYARRRRFGAAARALRETHETLASIAHAAGFADQSHLARTFARWSGMSPTLYRMRFARQPDADVARVQAATLAPPLC